MLRGAARAADTNGYDRSKPSFWQPPSPDWFLGDETAEQKGLAFPVGPATPAPLAEPQDNLKNVKLPPGFRIEVHACGLPEARPTAWSGNGTLFVGSCNASNVYAVTDKTGGMYMPFGPRSLSASRPPACPRCAAWTRKRGWRGLWRSACATAAAPTNFGSGMSDPKFVGGHPEPGLSSQGADGLPLRRALAERFAHRPFTAEAQSRFQQRTRIQQEKSRRMIAEVVEAQGNLPAEAVIAAPCFAPEITS